ncbi:MAG: hypothetical protein M0Z57_07190 [Deltaproteobacteria bacterium]|jgi:hypothetical protein|nr:hypothetical protein [Deltaproteobacteria bacterium]
MKQKSPHALKPLSLHPLLPKEALRLFMQVKPEKIEAKIKKLKAGKGKKKKND